MLVNEDPVTARLRAMVESGIEVSAAVLDLHRDEGFGLMELSVAVQRVANVDAREAKAIVARSTAVA
jgi:hypothetical protein